MKTVYLSGPITGWPDHAARFAAGVEYLRHMPGVRRVVNPKDVSACGDNACVETTGDPKSNGHTWSCWLRYDLAAMMFCDEVATLPGWETSRGAILEVQTALAVRMPVSHIDADDLDAYLAYQRVSR